MAYWWVDFVSGRSGFVEAPNHAAAIAIGFRETGNAARRARPIPYPAQPIIFQEPERPGKPQCPAFCYSPNMCAGRTSCPKSYACSE